MFDVLFSGCRSGRFPLDYARSHHGDRVTVHAYDAYQARKIREDVGAKSNVAVFCAAGLPDNARYDRAFYHATDKLVSAELELDTLQDIHIHLKEGAQLIAEGVDPAVLTETVWALAHQKKPVVPDEIAMKLMEEMV